MTQFVQPRLVNAPQGDPGVYLDFRFGRRAMLFDLGDLAPLTPRELLRVSHVFVSHAHMDHVAGFDPLLRLRLNRPRPLTIIGPQGFLRQAESRLAAFTWNLLDASSVDFRLTIGEFDGRRITSLAEFPAREAFRRRDMPLPSTGDGVVLAEDDLVVEAVALDHGGIPSLAFALQESLRVNVWRTALDELDLPVGPWLDAAKSAIRAGAPDDHPVAIPGRDDLPLGTLRGRVFQVGPGQRVAYVTDAADTAPNRERIKAVARGADHLFIETAFLDADQDLATSTGHLTARAAGEIARAAGADRVTGFHHSGRYADAPGRIADELSAAMAAKAPKTEIAPASADAEPNWIRRWRRDGLSRDAALARFDRLSVVQPAELFGDWRGSGLPTGHPLDGLLECLGWQGKRFQNEERVDPLVFHPDTAIDPGLCPLGIALRWPRFARSAPMRAGFALARPFIRARRPAARLSCVEFRGSLGAAMIYDRQPIVDHFRRIDPFRVLGLMQTRAAPPFFFLLTAGE